MRARYSQTGVRAELLSDLAEVGALARRDKSYISTSIGEPRIDGECVAKTLLRIPVENPWIEGQTFILGSSPVTGSVEE